MVVHNILHPVAYYLAGLAFVAQSLILVIAFLAWLDDAITANGGRAATLASSAPGTSRRDRRCGFTSTAARTRGDGFTSPFLVEHILSVNTCDGRASTCEQNSCDVARS
jgi:hypothetical protein